MLRFEFDSGSIIYEKGEWRQSFVRWIWGAFWFRVRPGIGSPRSPWPCVSDQWSWLLTISPPENDVRRENLPRGRKREFHNLKTRLLREQLDFTLGDGVLKTQVH